MSKLLKTNNGMTLVEVVVAILILGLTAGAMLGVFTISRMGTINAKNYIDGVNIAASRMEWLKGQDYSYLRSQAEAVSAPYTTDSTIVTLDMGSDVDGDGDLANDGDELSGRRITQMEPIGFEPSVSPTKYLQVTVTLTWNEYLIGGATWSASESLVTYINE